MDRIIDLEPRAVIALTAMTKPEGGGRVFRRADGSAWHTDLRVSGAQLNRAFQEIAAKAGIERKVFLHMIRHSWASWHYAVHKNLKKLREDVVGIFPNEGSIVRLIGAVLLEANDEWQLQHRYMQTEAMAEITPPATETTPPRLPPRQRDPWPPKTIPQFPPR